MGERGPVPQPTRLRVLKGNPSHRPLPQNEPQPRAAMPEMPDHLNAAAQKEWQQVARKLHRSRMLTEIDGELLGLYCLELATLKKAQAIIDRKGFTITTPSGYRQQRPEVGIVNRALEHVLRYGAHFGLTPASRSRIQVKQDADEEDVEGILS